MPPTILTPIDIKFPKKDRQIRPRLWYASGFGDPAETGFSGRVVDSSSTELTGTTIIHFPRQKHKKGTRRRRWLIQFNDSGKKLVSGNAILYVKGTSSPEVNRPFKLLFPSALHILIAIDPSIDDDKDITDEADAFVAFGTLGDYSIDSVRMNNIDSDFIFEDWDSLSWAAQFPSLDNGTYSLLALDAGNNSDGRTGLKVARP
jgi:hypothetical protein